MNTKLSWGKTCLPLAITPKRSLLKFPEGYLLRTFNQNNFRYLKIITAVSWWKLSMKTRIKELEVLEYVSSWCVVTNWHFNMGWLLREPKINETLNNTGPHVPQIHISTDKMCSFTTTLSILVFYSNSIKKKFFFMTMLSLVFQHFTGIRLLFPFLCLPLSAPIVCHPPLFYLKPFLCNSLFSLSHTSQGKC